MTMFLFSKDLASEMRIRDFRLEDLPIILNIERESFLHPWSYFEFLLAYMSSKSSILVADMDDDIAGYIVFEMSQGTGHITNIAVGKKLRKRGIGSKLLLESLRRMKMNGCHIVKLEVRVSNTHAIKFYKKYGFREMRRIGKYYGDEDAIVMFLDL